MTSQFGPTRAGAAVVDITPAPGCRLAGHGRDRIATAVHDPLYARALSLGVGESLMALVLLDCVGVTAAMVAAIAERVPGLRADQLIVAATGTVSGPDTIGRWGAAEGVSGVDEAVLERIVQGAGEAVGAALDAARPARLTLARAGTPVRSAVNMREPAQLDHEVAILRASDAVTGQGLAVLVNWGCHPEVYRGRPGLLSADFTAPLLREVEAMFGGVGLFANGSLGGHVAPAAAADDAAEAERIGGAVADAVISALRHADQSVDWGAFSFTAEPVRLPLENAALADAVADEVWPLQVERGEVVSQVSAAALGAATLVAVPGRPQPQVGRRWKRLMRRPFRFLISLAHDDIGPVLHRDDHERSRYEAEQHESLGPRTAGEMTLAVQRALNSVEG